MNNSKYVETLNFYAVLAQKTAEKVDPHYSVESIIAETVLFMNATSGSIMVYDKEENCLKLYVSAKHPAVKSDNNQKGPIAKISIGDGIAGNVFKTGIAAISSSNNDNSSDTKLVRKADKGSFLSVPLRFNGHPIGVMNLNRSEGLESFNENDLASLKSVETMISSLIEKERLMNTIEENRREIAGLYSMSTILSNSKDFVGRIIEFLEKLSNELSLEHCAVIEIKTDRHQKSNAPKISPFEIIAAHNLGETELQQMFTSVSENLRAQISTPANIYQDSEVEAPFSLKFNNHGTEKEMYCLPLLVEGTLSHMLLVSRKYLKQDKQEAKKHYRFLYLISHNLASSISREKMFQRIQEDQDILLENATRNRVFLEISKDLASTLDPYCILQKAFDQFRKVIAFTTISILLYDDLDENYRLIVQPCKPISARYQKTLSDTIYNLFVDYPADPPLSRGIYKEFATFKPQTAENKSEEAFVHALHLPIIFGDKVKGLIHLARSAEDEPFNNNDLDITSQFTGIFITSIKNAMIHKRTEKLAFTDPLTELFNHRYFQETLNHEFIRAKRYNKPLSLMVIDIDFFKKFNDKYGHLVGDKVLRHVAGIFKSSLREQIDTVARYGGEEFAVILPETSLEGAEVFAERIRSSVEKTKLKHESSELSVTLSVGVASTMTTNCEKTSALIEAADTALYRAKDNGRNKVEKYTERKI